MIGPSPEVRGEQSLDMFIEVARATQGVPLTELIQSILNSLAVSESAPEKQMSLMATVLALALRRLAS